MEHLTNCHGEISFIVQSILALPFVGVWLRNAWVRPRLSGRKGNS